MNPSPSPRCVTELTGGDTLHIRPWPDEVIDTLGFDPRCSYVENSGCAL